MTRVILVNGYGDEVCELLKREDGYYEVPEELMLAVGDELRVEEVWTER